MSFDFVPTFPVHCRAGYRKRGLPLLWLRACRIFGAHPRVARPRCTRMGARLILDLTDRESNVVENQMFLGDVVRTTGA